MKTDPNRSRARFTPMEPVQARFIPMKTGPSPFLLEQIPLKAQYGPAECFGTHFWSPIRRVPDRTWTLSLCHTKGTVFAFYWLIFGDFHNLT
jgi:hypothetical protein